MDEDAESGSDESEGEDVSDRPDRADSNSTDTEAGNSVEDISEAEEETMTVGTAVELDPDSEDANEPDDTGEGIEQPGDSIEEEDIRDSPTEVHGQLEDQGVDRDDDSGVRDSVDKSNVEEAEGRSTDLEQKSMPDDHRGNMVESDDEIEEDDDVASTTPSAEDEIGMETNVDEPMPEVPGPTAVDDEEPPYVPEDVQKYARFKKMDGAAYDRVNQFLRDRTYVTAREWAIARLCSDFRTETGIEMTKIGDNLPTLVPFMTDTYSPQAVNQARSSFETKVRKSGATFLYGAMCDFFTAEELDDIMYEATEVAKFLLEVEGVDLDVEDELEAEERISSVMREVREASKALRDEEFDE